MKVNPVLAALVIGSLRGKGGLTFARPAAISRAEAAAIYEWAKREPIVAAAIKAKGTSDHEAFRLFKSVVDYFATEHPQAADAPAPWPDRGPRGTPTADNPFADLFDDEVSSVLEWARTQPGYTEAIGDKAHAGHAEKMALTEKLVEMAGRVQADDEEAQAVANDENEWQSKKTSQDMPALTAAQQARIDELRKDPAWADPKHINHKAAVEAVTREYENAQRPGAGTPARSAPPSTGKSPQERIAALQKNPAYRDRNDPGHAAAMQEAEAAFAAAYPEPPAGGGAQR